MNTENLSPAMQKAIEAGGTKNVVIGNALVKRGIFQKTKSGIFPFMSTAEFLNLEYAMMVAETVSDPREEDVSNISGGETDQLHRTADYVYGPAVERASSPDLEETSHVQGGTPWTSEDASDPQPPAVHKMRVDFQRIGGFTPGLPVFFGSNEDTDAIAEKVRRFASGFLRASTFEVEVNLRSDPAEVLLNGGRYGKGIISIDRS